METQSQKRVNDLIQLLKKTDKIHLKDAAKLLAVSEMTIRRDLSNVDGSLSVLGGYVVSDARHQITPYFLSDQQDKQVYEKQHIANIASQCVVENDTVFFDCGTTIPFIIDAIDDDVVFTAICYSLNAFLALQNKPNCKTILCGGHYQANNAIFSPIGQPSELNSICPNKAFISAAGIDIKQGVTCYHFDELDMKRAAIQRSGQTMLIADHTKFDQVRPAFIGGLTLFNQIITDKAPSNEFITFFNNHKITLIY
ncbi:MULTISPECIES: DNA-binding transcriptional repressor DeoR [unclassified Gilliamella]|uniref:DNA-binding transcriptional repressor DeoR n=1 Tax=unclassified Gilliamella TaxID=2685620 RepID=UPI001324CD06|nr:MULTISPECIES: DNA-binding transcriptional repressor DeoR [unclassified Gilliamella]MWN31856.1 DNA-binding transcriptional repressor DeoR [Gilliamella sp. Pra-s60]MWP29222.1 DNA-binding transcriptional repressor DeoR [Gilliamella sp. Pra-s54]